MNSYDKHYVKPIRNRPVPGIQPSNLCGGRDVSQQLERMRKEQRMMFAWEQPESDNLNRRRGARDKADRTPSQALYYGILLAVVITIIALGLWIATL